MFLLCLWTTTEENKPALTYVYIHKTKKSNICYILALSFHYRGLVIVKHLRNLF